MGATGLYNRFGKRLIDGAVSGLALVLLSPLFLAVALLVAAGVGFPLLFRQQRPGLKGRPFTLYKFRTMSRERDDEGELLPDEARMGVLGRLLRRWGLDELPEFWNIFKGDMSLVGPRPLLMAYLDRYTPRQMRRHAVRPGLTGWAVIQGRNALTWEEKFEYDLWYVDHVSLALDVKILALTFWRLVRPGTLTDRGQVTANEFMGSSPEEPNR